MFFEYSLRLGKEVDPMSAIIFKGDEKQNEAKEHLEISIWAWEVLRYKYKFFEASEVRINIKSEAR